MSDETAAKHRARVEQLIGMGDGSSDALRWALATIDAAQREIAELRGRPVLKTEWQELTARCAEQAARIEKLEARIALDAQAFEGAVRQLDAETYFSLRDLMGLAARSNRALLASPGKGEGE